MHTPVLHTCPVPHEAPSALVVHAVVLAPGWQVWQPLVEFAAPDA
jgi:hypothetical protein